MVSASAGGSGSLIVPRGVLKRYQRISKVTPKERELTCRWDESSLELIELS